MKITPLDIRKQEFRKSLRGFDIHEVQAFLEMVANEMEELVRGNTSFSEKLKELDQKVEDYRRMEKTLQDTLTSAQRTTDELRRNAEKEAELLVRNAKIQVDHLLEEARTKIVSLRSEIASLQKQRDAFLANFKGLVDAQGRILENYRSQPSTPEESRRSVPERPGIEPRRESSSAPNEQKVSAPGDLFRSVREA